MRVARHQRTIITTLALVSVLYSLYRRHALSAAWASLWVKSPATSFALNLQPFTSPEKLLAEANRLAWLSNWPGAGALYSRAEKLFRDKGDTRDEIYARVGRVWAQAETTSLVDASESLTQQLGDPIVRRDPRLKLWCLAALGYAVTEINLPSAKRAWMEARSISKLLGDARWESRLTGELGILAFMEGDSRQAARMIGSALLSATAAGDVGTQIRDLEELGHGFDEVKRYPEAIAFLDRAIKLANETPGSGFPFMAYEGKALALIGQGKSTDANNLLDGALGIARVQHNKAHETQILILLGEGEMRAGDRNEAIRLLEEAARVGREYGSFYPISQTMFDLTRLYRASGDLKSAEERASIGLDASKHLANRYYLPRDLTVLADLKTLNGNLIKADRLYDQAEHVIDGILNSLAEPYWNSSLANTLSETYLHHFELAVRRGELKHALNVMERVRGRTAAAALQNKPQSSAAGAPEVTALEAKVSELQLDLMHSNDPLKRSRLMEQLIEYERRRDWATLSRQEWFERPASTAAIQSTLRDDELVLEYVLDEPQAYCVWISQKAAGVKVLPSGRQRIEELTRTLLDRIHAKRGDTGAAAELFTVLFPPTIWRETRGRLIIVPDGVLHLLPFEILRDSKGNLLVESQIISYVPAATVLHVLRTRKNASSTRPFLGVGDVAYQNQGSVSAKLATPTALRGRLLRQFSDVLGMPLYDLPHTREEVLEVSKFAGNDAVILLGRQATETAFKSQPVADFKVIHLAVHGFADAQFPERSGLVLGRDPASRDDGLLQVWEIMELRFNADLVTLSACDTAVGKLQGEEGVTNLPEAFLVSGAKAVVASLWGADDNATLALMTHFYAHIAEGQDKAAALRQAKLDLLSKYGFEASPYYWGGFVLVGDGSAIAGNPK
jgi:CHAT domain-containing protein